jgi:hypothetical protein
MIVILYFVGVCISIYVSCEIVGDEAPLGLITSFSWPISWPIRGSLKLLNNCFIGIKYNMKYKCNDIVSPISGFYEGFEFMVKSARKRWLLFGEFVYTIQRYSGLEINVLEKDLKLVNARCLSSLKYR